MPQVDGGCLIRSVSLPVLFIVGLYYTSLCGFGMSECKRKYQRLQHDHGAHESLFIQDGCV